MAVGTRLHQLVVHFSLQAVRGVFQGVGHVEVGFPKDFECFGRRFFGLSGVGREEVVDACFGSCVLPVVDARRGSISEVISRMSRASSLTPLGSRRASTPGADSAQAAKAGTSSIVRVRSFMGRKVKGFDGWHPRCVPCPPEMRKGEVFPPSPFHVKTNFQAEGNPLLATIYCPIAILMG